MATTTTKATTKDGLALLREGYCKGAAEPQAPPKSVPDHIKDFVNMVNEMDLLIDGQE